MDPTCVPATAVQPYQYAEPASNDEKSYTGRTECSHSEDRRQPGLLVYVSDFANIFKAFVGSNFLSIPFAFGQCGLALGIAGLLCITALTGHCCRLLIKCKYHAIQRLLQKQTSTNSLLKNNDSDIYSHQNQLYPQVYTNHLTTNKTSDHKGSNTNENGSPAETERHLVKTLQYGDLARMCLGRWGLCLTNAAVFITQTGFCINYAIFTANTLVTFFPVHNCTVQIQNNVTVTSPDCQYLGNSSWKPWTEGHIAKSRPGGDPSFEYDFLYAMSNLPEYTSSTSSATPDQDLNPDHLFGPHKTNLIATSAPSQTTAAASLSASVTSEQSSVSSSLNQNISAVPGFSSRVTKISTLIQILVNMSTTTTVISDSTPLRTTPSSVLQTVTRPPSTSLVQTPLMSASPALRPKSPAFASQTLTSPAPGHPTSTSSSSLSTTLSLTSSLPMTASASATLRPAFTPSASVTQNFTSSTILTPSTSVPDTVYEQSVWTRSWTGAPDLRLMFLFPVAVFVLLVLPRRMRGLGVISGIGNVGLLVGIAVTFSSLIAEFHVSNTWQWAHLEGLPIFFGTVASSFEGAGTMLPVEGSMDGNRHNYGLYLSGGLVLLTSVHICLNILSYLTFGSDIAQILTMNLQAGSGLSTVVNVSLMVGILFTFPLMIFPAVHLLEAALLGTGKPNDKKGETSEDTALLLPHPHQKTAAPSGPNTGAEQISPWKRNVVRIVLVLIIGVLGMMLRDSFAYVTAFIGALGSTFVAFILPCLFHLRLCWHRLPLAIKLKDLSIIVVGVVFCVTGVYSVIRDMTA